MIVYLIGSSGAGKSKLAGRLSAKHSEFVHVNLDDVIDVRRPKLRWGAHRRKGWIKFWKFTKNILVQYEKLHERLGKEIIYLIDVGAGSIHLDNYGGKRVFNFFKPRKKFLISINTPKRIAFENASNRECGFWKNKTFERFQHCEFSKARKRIYQLGRKLICKGTKADAEKDSINLGKLVRKVIK